jgi:hypothetical protein
MSNIKLFESKQIRSVWNEPDQKWYFVVEDVVLVLTDSKDPKQYVKRMRQRDDELAKGWVQLVPTLWVETAGGKQRMGCANAKSLLRIIQSIPSPKAEPFKQWLAQVGSDRLDEIENPELATQRTRELYKAKGYPDDWIFSMLGEASTTAIVKTKDPKGFIQNKVAAKQGGTIAGDARKALEIKTGEKVVSKENYLPESKKTKKIK